MGIFKKAGIALLLFSASALTFASQTTVAKQQFIQKMVTRYHFNQHKLSALLNLSPNPKVIASMNKPFEKEPWFFYRHFFITKSRIQLGAVYLKKHHAALMEMQKKYGIPANIITAIIGIETEYGTHLGTYSVLRTLYTLGFYYPKRAAFFRKELQQYLILTRDNHLNPKTIKGSYAGALGIPQFMPSSYRYYGVPYYPHHRVNLFNNDDAIASVANYFHRNGWHANQPIARLLRTKNQPINSTIGKRLALPLKHSTQYWETYQNFDVIMSYNHNVVYAMAVYQLSQAIQKQYALNQK